MALKKYCIKIPQTDHIDQYEIEARSKRAAKARIKRQLKLHKLPQDVDVVLQPETISKETIGMKMADLLTGILGSWRFILIQSGVLGVWVLLNVFGVIHPWDPYPFILLNLALSLQAAFAAPIIMMSQNRQAEKDRKNLLDDSKVNKVNLIIDKQTNENIADIMFLLLEQKEEFDKRFTNLEKKMKKLNKVSGKKSNKKSSKK